MNEGPQIGNEDITKSAIPVPNEASLEGKGDVPREISEEEVEERINKLFENIRGSNSTEDTAEEKEAIATPKQAETLGDISHFLRLKKIRTEIQKQKEEMNAEDGESTKKARTIADLRTKEVRLEIEEAQRAKKNTRDRILVIEKINELKGGNTGAIKNRKAIIQSAVQQACNDLSPEFEALGLDESGSEIPAGGIKEKLAAGINKRWFVSNESHTTEETELTTDILNEFPKEVALAAASNILGPDVPKSMKAEIVPVVKDILSKKAEIEALTLEYELSTSASARRIVESGTADAESLKRLKFVTECNQDLKNKDFIGEQDWDRTLVYNENGDFVTQSSAEIKEGYESGITKTRRICDNLISRVYTYESGNTVLFVLEKRAYTIRDIVNLVEPKISIASSENDEILKAKVAKETLDEKVGALKSEIEASIANLEI